MELNSNQLNNLWEEHKLRSKVEKIINKELELSEWHNLFYLLLESDVGDFYSKGYAEALDDFAIP